MRQLIAYGLATILSLLLVLATFWYGAKLMTAIFLQRLPVQHHSIRLIRWQEEFFPGFMPIPIPEPDVKPELLENPDPDHCVSQLQVKTA